jgi:hypothetical protein
MDHKKKWFFLKNNQVSGPFYQTDIAAHLQSNPEALVWGSGMGEWQSIEEWEKFLQDQAVKTIDPNSHLMWWMKVSQQVTGPLTYQSLLQALKVQPFLMALQIRQEPQQTWKSIFDFPNLIEEVGANRRIHPRAPLNGIFKFVRNKVEFEALITSISEGGLGVTDAPFLTAGDQLKGSLSSPLLPTEIDCEVEVLTQRGDGTCGLKFLNLSLESTSHIISYLRRFALGTENPE